MALINEHYLDLEGSYLFAEIARKVVPLKRRTLMRILFG